MKLLPLLIFLSVLPPCYAEDGVTPQYETLRPPIIAPASDINDIGTSYDSSKDLQLSDKALEKLQPVPNVPAEPAKKPDKPADEKKAPLVNATDSNRHKIGFFKKFHPDNIEAHHPKLNKGWNCYMFVYEHGLRQSLDIVAKVAQIATPFVFN